MIYIDLQATTESSAMKLKRLAALSLLSLSWAGHPLQAEEQAPEPGVILSILM